MVGCVTSWLLYLIYTFIGFYFFHICYNIAGTVGIEKKNEATIIDKVGSPPLSARLREITNNLRLLEASTPLHVLMPKQSDVSHGNLESCDIVEPKTPKTETDVRTLEIVKYSSPWEKFHTRSSGVKVVIYLCE